MCKVSHYKNAWRKVPLWITIEWIPVRNQKRVCATFVKLIWHKWAESIEVFDGIMNKCNWNSLLTNDYITIYDKLVGKTLKNVFLEEMHKIYQKPQRKVILCQKADNVWLNREIIKLHRVKSLLWERCKSNQNDALLKGEFTAIRYKVRGKAGLAKDIYCMNIQYHNTLEKCSHHDAHCFGTLKGDAKMTISNLVFQIWLGHKYTYHTDGFRI